MCDPTLILHICPVLQFVDAGRFQPAWADSRSLRKQQKSAVCITTDDVQLLVADIICVKLCRYVSASCIGTTLWYWF